jgi:hypothetical protein
MLAEVEAAAGLICGAVQSWLLTKGVDVEIGRFVGESLSEGQPAYSQGQPDVRVEGHQLCIGMCVLVVCAHVYTTN